MKFEENVKLSEYITMRIGGKARFLCIINSEEELLQAFKYADKNKLNTFILGEGSNTVFTDKGFDGLVIVNKLKGIEVDLEQNLITASSGESWDKIVELSVNNNLVGTEALSLIPGTIGAAPVNNIGAYGQEIKDTILNIRVYDKEINDFTELNNSDCEFSYRDSIFKSSEYGRYVITKVTLKLSKYNKDTYSPPSYPSLQAELSKNNNKANLQKIREAVINVRSSKLPDPKKLANSGSFFKNPIVNSELADYLKQKYPDMPVYDFGNDKKIAAGWLIENAGLKGYEKDGIGIYSKQSLVLINKSAKNYVALKNMIDLIIQKVYEMYGVKLTPEPEII